MLNFIQKWERIVINVIILCPHLSMIKNDALIRKLKKNFFFLNFFMKVWGSGVRQPCWNQWFFPHKKKI